MSGFFRSSIGKKVIMSITGLFLVVFLLVHLSVNLTLLIGKDAFNASAHFMGHNPMMKIMEPILALGFLLHILYSIILTIKNMASRPIGYKNSGTGISSTWSSRNMLVLGALVFFGLALHLINYYYKFKFTDLISSGKTTEYDIVVGLFTKEYWYYIAIYILWFIFLGFHLIHAFQSSFQTLGLNNKIWAKRWKAIGWLYTLVITAGFTIIPVYFIVKAL